MSQAHWHTSDDRLLRAAEREVEQHLREKRDDAQLASFMEQRREAIIDAARRYFTRHYDLRNPDRRPAPDRFNHRTMCRALELMHVPGMRDDPAVLALLARIVRDIDCEADSKASKAAAGCLSLAIRDSQIEPGDEARESMVEASFRDEAFTFGNRLTFARWAFPTRAARYLEMLETTYFKRDESAVPELDWLLRFRDHRRFDEALAAVFGAVENDEQRGHLYRRLLEEDALSDLLPAVAREVARLSQPSHAIAVRIAKKVGGRAAELLLVWLIEHGHRRAVPAAVRALAPLASPRSTAALELVSGAWAPAIADLAARAVEAVTSRAWPDVGPEEERHDATARGVEGALRGQTDPTGWSFADKQLLDLCAQAEVENEVAVKVFDAAVDVERLVDLARLAYDRDWAAETEEAGDLASESRQPINMRSALWLLGRAPWCTHPEAVELLIQAMESARADRVRFSARLSLVDSMDEGHLKLTRAERERVARQLDDPIWSSTSLYEIALLALPLTLDDWWERYVERRRGADAAALPERELKRLARLPADDDSRRALRLLLSHGDENEQRALFGAFPNDAGEDLLPVLLDVAAAGSATTRLAAVETLERLKLPASEPYLHEIVDQEHDEVVRRAAVRALGETVTRAGLERLLDLQRDGQVGNAATHAAERVRERFPEDSLEGERGGLSLDEPSPTQGALALAQNAGGGLALGETTGATGAVEAGAPETEPAVAPLLKWSSGQSERWGWDRLPAPPRRLGLGVWLTQLVLADSWKVGAWWGGMVLALWPMAQGASFSDNVGYTIVVLGIAAIGLAFAHSGHRTLQRLSVLRKGRPGYATLKEVGQRTRRSGSSSYVEHRYDFELLADDGKRYDHRVTRRYRVKRLSKHTPEPALYTLSGGSLGDGRGSEAGVQQILIFDTLRSLCISGSGRIRARALHLLVALVAVVLVFWTAAAAIVH